MRFRRSESRKYRVYPQFLDSSLTRNQGRRVPRPQAIEQPLANEIRLASEHLGHPAIVVDAAYSRAPSDRRSLILIEKHETPKTKLLRDLAREVQGFVRPALEKQRLEREQELRKKKHKPKKPDTYYKPKSQKRDGKARRRR